MAMKRLNRAGKRKQLSLLVAGCVAIGCWAGTAQAGAAPAGGGQAAAGAQKGAAAKKAPEKAPAPTVSRLTIEGRRDPFKLPPPPGKGGPQDGDGITGPLPPGKRGLVIGRLRLEGIVRLDTTNEMIAVVDTNANRAYFLRENDAVFNGVVTKITPDSVYFRENVLDQQGRVQTREVVKRLSQRPGEGR
ncbi:MAG: hypothetical protein HYS33_00895 [Acidobacteria bacterium]|nr:hypothetical protein [Acidobacteriota bacterium]